VGAAGAGAGFGTSALFNDTESFENNSLVAGELDLKVDWEEHYSYPQLYGFDDPTSGLDYDLRRSDPADDAYVGLPDPESPVVWVHEDDLDAYMANTAIEAFPAPDNSRSQVIETDGFTYTPCEDGADLDEDLGDFDGDARRTQNADTYDGEEREPLVSLSDVKPGDFGELTLSFHLCDNPGYVWLRAANVSEDGGTNTEPEREAEGDAENDATLAEEIRTVWWYDAGGDNILQTDCSEAIYLSDTGGNPEFTDSPFDDESRLFEVELTDEGGSPVAELTQLTTLPTDDFTQVDAIAATPSGDEIYVIDKDSAHLGVYDIGDDDFTDLGPIDGIEPEDEVVLASYAPDGTLFAAGQGDVPDSDDNYLFTVDTSSVETTSETQITGVNVQGADIAFAANGVLYLYSSFDGKLYTVDRTTGAASAVGSSQSDKGAVTGLAVESAGKGPLLGSSESENAIIELDPVTGGIDTEYEMQLSGSDEEYPYGFGDLTVAGLCGEVFRRGTLEEDLNALSDGGLPLDGNLATGFDELADGPADPDRECFAPNLTYYVGFGWYLPEGVGNEIQGDSVSFDLGFYTEQCRNNPTPDAPGTPADAPTDTPAGSTVTVQGFPNRDDDLGATIKAVEVTFPDLSGASFGGTDWSVGPSGTENVSINGDTVRLEYPDNSNTYTADTFLKLTMNDVSTGGTAEFVFEPDDDSSVDDTSEPFSV
jgi:predicted ribosomally synthesized peptide with SipW-like signal peptide